MDTTPKFIADALEGGTADTRKIFESGFDAGAAAQRQYGNIACNATVARTVRFSDGLENCSRCETNLATHCVPTNALNDMGGDWCGECYFLEANRKSRERLKVSARFESVAGPADQWPGKCFAIASHLAETMDGSRAVYGHYRGFVHQESVFYSRAESAGWVQHGWVVTKDGLIVDPTRWVFESVRPYIFVTDPEDLTSWDTVEYDEGGSVFRAQSSCKFPSAETSQYKPIPTFRLEPSILRAVGAGRITTVEQLTWLAHLPRAVLGKHAATVYAAIIDSGHRFLIPIDNWRSFQHERPLRGSPDKKNHAERPRRTGKSGSPGRAGDRKKISGSASRKSRKPR